VGTLLQPAIEVIGVRAHAGRADADRLNPSSRPQRRIRSASSRHWLWERDCGTISRNVLEARLMMDDDPMTVPIANRLYGESGMRELDRRAMALPGMGEAR
jgi:hypothetical protein